MPAEPTRSERVLRAVAAAALSAWSVAVVVLALSFAGPSLGVTWAARLGLLAAGTLGTAWLVRRAVRGWQQAITRPLPAGRGSHWLARQPGWLLAAGCWVLFVAPEYGAGLWLSPDGHQQFATAGRLAQLVTSTLGCCLVALGCRVLWRYQAANSRRRLTPALSLSASP